MSRHTRGECVLPLFQLEILDFSRRNRHIPEMKDGKTLFYVGSNKSKAVDMLSITAPTKTLLKRFKDKESAERWGARCGSLISCEKVDISPYYENIEHLNLKQEPIVIQIEREEYILNKAVELGHKKDFGNNKIEIEKE